MQHNSNRNDTHISMFFLLLVLVLFAVLGAFVQRPHHGPVTSVAGTLLSIPLPVIGYRMVNCVYVV